MPGPRSLPGWVGMPGPTCLPAGVMSMPGPRVLSGGVGIVGPRSLLGTSEGTPWKVHPLPGKVHLDKVHLLEGTPPGTDI